MKMPDFIDERLFAPCGMNCAVCYKHCYSKKPCPGCLFGDEGKPGHCRNCRIRDCAQGKTLRACFACEVFPCKLIKNLEKSYQKRYRVSLVQNSLTVKENGIAAFLLDEREAWRCPHCGGVISLHDKECSECRVRFASGDIGSL